MISKKATKFIAGLIALLLVAALVGGSVISAIGMAQAASISELRGQISDIDARKKEVQELLDSLEGEIENNTAKKSALEQQMELTQQDIDATEEIIEQLEADIAQKEEEIVVAQADLDEKTELFETRIRVMYEDGDITYLDILLGSESLSDMLSNLEMVSQIMDYDKKVVEDYKAAKQALEDMKAALESDKAEQEEYQASLQAKYDDLDSQKAEIEAIIEELESDAEQKRKEEEALEAEQDEINAEIERLSAIEAEKARQEAASSGGSSGGSGVTYTGSGVLTTWPTPGYGITDDYGWRTHPIYGTRKFHKGADIAAPKGVVVKCAGDGTVVKSYLSSSYGNYVVVSHGNGIMTAYAHLSKRSVSVGDVLSAGDQIGLVGSTGNSTGNHLHFEVYVNGSTTDPANYFS